MKKLVSLLMILAVTSCATMFKGADQNVSIQASDKKAKIYVNNELVGTGHANYNFKKNEEYFIRAEVEDCASNTIQPKKSFDPVTLLGILIDWGIISILLVDGAATGAWQEFDQENFHLEVSCDS